jgi:uncharacterized membrane protein
MWIIYTLLTFAFWGIADLFYKIGNKDEGKYNHLITGIFVGLVMGIHATIYLIVDHTDISIMDMIKYLPVSFFYISSMIIGYKGLKFLELSISSPVQNTSGVITAILLMLFFHESYEYPFFIAVILIFIGIILLSIIEVKDNKKKRLEYKKKNKISKVITFTMIFPLLYCILDGAGTFLDGIYLDKMELISEGSALVAYEYTFLIYGICTFFYLKYKKVKIKFFDEKPKLFAAIFETAGQFFYVFAMSGNSTISAPIVGSYCILSLLLSKIFLKEKLSIKEYISIILVIIGIVILSIMDI